MATTPEQGDKAGPSQGYDASDFTSTRKYCIQTALRRSEWGSVPKRWGTASATHDTTLVSSIMDVVPMEEGRSEDGPITENVTRQYRKQSLY